MPPPAHPKRLTDAEKRLLTRWIKQELGITVIMVEHDMALVNQVSDRVMALNYGKVIAMGTPQQVQTHPDVVKAYLGGEVETAA